MMRLSYMHRGLPWRCGDAPHRVPDIISDQQRTGRIHGDADRAAVGHTLAIRRHKAGDEIFRLALRFAVAKGDVDDLVASERTAIPRAVLADEGAAAEMLWKRVRGIESKAKRRHMR